MGALVWMEHQYYAVAVVSKPKAKDTRFFDTGSPSDNKLLSRSGLYRKIPINVPHTREIWLDYYSITGNKNNPIYGYFPISDTQGPFSRAFFNRRPPTPPPPTKMRLRCLKPSAVCGTCKILVATVNSERLTCSSHSYCLLEKR